MEIHGRLRSAGVTVRILSTKVGQGVTTVIEPKPTRTRCMQLWRGCATPAVATITTHTVIRATIEKINIIFIILRVFLKDRKYICIE